MEYIADKDLKIVAHLAILREYKNGSTFELNKTKQDGKPEKWDLRRWHIDKASGKKLPGRGIPMDDMDMMELKAVLDEYC